ncbi:hypothetical protein [Methylacidiphilum caldifontis]|uniref:Uncharacterized protein n=1 Tax=Methylacidiphilum caldifontis TaxID=2795386 RepID=A0A4Y8P6E4_9BACT|nr:hypothetical protein [Methylacidiphilum caldifontis]TFE65721.1 hypothetical protein A7Q10_03040 [Methylacidiphilum caldifontis]
MTHARRLTEEGARLWPDLLREAFLKYDDNWLKSQLFSRGLMRASEYRRSRRSIITASRVSIRAAETLAEGEFNRYYMRGLCRYMIETGGTEVEVYRGKNVENPRLGSVAMIERRLLVQDLLNDLRISQGIEPALGLPPGPNSGLTVRRVEP